MIRLPALLCCVVFSSCMLAPPLASAGPAKGFDKFCKAWMKKLQVRERDNLASAKVRKRGDRFVVAYVGYGDKAVDCQTKATGQAANPYVGKLVYHELQLEKTGARRAATREARPRIKAQTEILEIFRYDGKGWVY